MNVTVIGGLGRLGSVIAAQARHHYPVRIADKKPGGESVAEATRDADLVIVMVNAPSRSWGAYDVGNVVEACGQIDLSRYRMVVISTTVNPGDTEGVIRLMLEKSGKTAHKDFGLAFVPEFVRQGSVRDDFARPGQIVAGCETEVEQAAIQEFYGTVCENDPPFVFMSVVSAEIAKVGLNTCVTAKVAKAAEIAWLCQRTAGADARDVLDAIGKDPRIGSQYFSAGPPVGGPCFPRDDAAFGNALSSAGIGEFVTVTDAVSRWRGTQLDLMADLVGGCGKVGVAGLSYKPGYADDTESPGVVLARRVNAETYDPDLDSTCRTFAELAGKSDIIVLAMPFEGIEAILDFALKPHQEVWDWWGTFGDRFNRFGKGPKC